MDMGPWGLVTLALGATPTLTAELELELELLPVEVLVLPVLDDELLLLLEELLLEELELDLPPDLPPAFELELELAAALRPNLRLPTEPCIAMPASMGARPRAIVISQRVRLIRSLRASGSRTNPSARRAMPTERKNPRQPARYTQWLGNQTSPPTTYND
jgi:hypothetical protein